jgi:uncharacterized protein YodC (DUF2158 family)
MNKEFKIGDVVEHKTTEEFEMVIIDNCFFKNPTMEQTVQNSKDPNRFLCKYYNKNTNQWEEKCFENIELESLE